MKKMLVSKSSNTGNPPMFARVTADTVSASTDTAKKVTPKVMNKTLFSKLKNMLAATRLSLSCNFKYL